MGWPEIPALRFAPAGMTVWGRLRRRVPSCHSGLARWRPLCHPGCADAPPHVIPVAPIGAYRNPAPLPHGPGFRHSAAASAGMTFLGWLGISALRFARAAMTGWRRLRRWAPSCHSGCADRRIPESGALISWPGIPALRFAPTGMTVWRRLRRWAPSCHSGLARWRHLCHSGCADRRIPESGALASWRGIPILGCRFGRNDISGVARVSGTPLCSSRNDTAGTVAPAHPLVSFRLRR